MTNILLYALLWLSFGYMHSLLTLPKVRKVLLPVFGRAYRFAYNLFAMGHFLIVYLIGRTLFEHSAFNVFSSDLGAGLFNAISIIGVIVLLLALRQYDLGLFSGLSQLFNRQQSTTASVEPLNTGGLNRWVRHPLYTGLFMYIWGGATNQFGLWTAIFASLYLLIGVHFEEKKLIALYGDAYIRYQSSVSAFLPLKWR